VSVPSGRPPRRSGPACDRRDVRPGVDSGRIRHSVVPLARDAGGALRRPRLDWKRSFTPQPPEVRIQIPLGDFDSGLRVILEMDADWMPPITRAFLRHIDDVRLLLAMGHLSPDDAYMKLRDLSWLRKK
jgi:hypothetical protein